MLFDFERFLIKKIKILNNNKKKRRGGFFIIISYLVRFCVIKQSKPNFYTIWDVGLYIYICVHICMKEERNSNFVNKIVRRLKHGFCFFFCFFVLLFIFATYHNVC